MKFKFSLDPVLKVRKHQEKLQQQKLAEEVAKQQQINNMREEVQDKLQNFLTTTSESEVKNVHTVRRRITHVEQIHQHMQRLSEDLNKADVKVSAERVKLAAANKNLRIMEKVKEIEHKLFSDTMAKEEQKFLDEIATQSFSR